MLKCYVISRVSNVAAIKSKDGMFISMSVGLPNRNGYLAGEIKGCLSVMFTARLKECSLTIYNDAELCQSIRGVKLTLDSRNSPVSFCT